MICFMFQSIIIRVFFGEKLFRLCHSADSCFSIKIEIYPFIWHDGVGNMKGATSFSYRLWANPFSSSDVGYQTNSVLFSFHNTIAFSNFEFIGILPLSLKRNIILLQLDWILRKHQLQNIYSRQCKIVDYKKVFWVFLSLNSSTKRNYGYKFLLIQWPTFIVL